MAEMSPNYGAILLGKQLKEFYKNPPTGISVGLKDENNLYVWEVMIEGPADTLYEEGFFPAELRFPMEFPNKPPEMRFLTPNFWHPNVYEDGRVCISILHEAVEDQMNPDESIDEKWRPILSIEGVLVSVISMLSDPNFSSPANIEASVQMRNDPNAYRSRIRQLVRRSQEIMMGG